MLASSAISVPALSVCLLVPELDELGGADPHAFGSHWYPWVILAPVRRRRDFTVTGPLLISRLAK